MFLKIADQRIHGTARSAIGGESFAPRRSTEASRYLKFDPYAAGLGRQSVPRIFADRLPADMDTMRSSSQAQLLFIRIMLPVVLSANEIVSLQRSMLRADTDERLLTEAMWHYGAATPEQLERRFDIIPPSLLIALAGARTDWGRNVSGPGAGQHYPASICTPSDLPPGAAQATDGLRRTHHANLLGPALDAIHGLNTAEGGGALRRERARQSRRRRLDGYRLALLLQGVGGLSSRTVKDTLYAIESGALTRIDDARLAPPCAVFH